MLSMILWCSLATKAVLGMYDATIKHTGSELHAIALVISYTPLLLPIIFKIG